MSMLAIIVLWLLETYDEWWLSVSGAKSLIKILYTTPEKYSAHNLHMRETICPRVTTGDDTHLNAMQTTQSQRKKILFLFCFCSIRAKVIVLMHWNQMNDSSSITHSQSGEWIQWMIKWMTKAPIQNAIVVMLGHLGSTHLSRWMWIFLQQTDLEELEFYKTGDQIKQMLLH